ncbi:unnamed protein product [Amoebophrya sp. A120]|nr:unnamed protein product [Amoebophrya sp. A120]|eukprot:GSA120T00021777001.1
MSASPCSEVLPPSFQGALPVCKILETKTTTTSSSSSTPASPPAQLLDRRRSRTARGTTSRQKMKMSFYQCATASSKSTLRRVTPAVTVSRSGKYKMMPRTRTSTKSALFAAFAASTGGFAPGLQHQLLQQAFAYPRFRGKTNRHSRTSLESSGSSNANGGGQHFEELAAERQAFETTNGAGGTTEGASSARSLSSSGSGLQHESDIKAASSSSALFLSANGPPGSGTTSASFNTGAGAGGRNNDGTFSAGDEQVEGNRVGERNAFSAFLQTGFDEDTENNNSSLASTLIQLAEKIQIGFGFDNKDASAESAKEQPSRTRTSSRSIAPRPVVETTSSTDETGTAFLQQKERVTAAVAAGPPPTAVRLPPAPVGKMTPTPPKPETTTPVPKAQAVANAGVVMPKPVVNTAPPLKQQLPARAGSGPGPVPLGEQQQVEADTVNTDRVKVKNGVGWAMLASGQKCLTKKFWDSDGFSLIVAADDPSVSEFADGVLNLSADQENKPEKCTLKQLNEAKEVYEVEKKKQEQMKPIQAGEELANGDAGTSTTIAGGDETASKFTLDTGAATIGLFVFLVVLALMGVYAVFAGYCSRGSNGSTSSTSGRSTGGSRNSASAAARTSASSSSVNHGSSAITVQQQQGAVMSDEEAPSSDHEGAAVDESQGGFGIDP